MFVRTQLRRGDVDALSQAEAALVRARELIDEIHAKSFQPAWHELRAQLAQQRGDSYAAQRDTEEARRLYAEIGATLQTQRLDRELEAYGGGPSLL